MSEQTRHRPRAHFPTPEDAEAAFYDAIERGDLEALMAVWCEDEEIVCIHPGGPRLVGLAAVRSAWQAIFDGPRFRLRIAQRARWQSGLMAVHNVVEVPTLADDPNAQEPVFATNVFVRGADGWRLVAHHAGLGPDTDDTPGATDTPRVLH
ncbi:nuclear transport factor 2 family protein [Oryzomicrobium sp.]|uniref:YybH family protein n=1 Tax=Oryzomicrobium sp. TaxID=1911578 RepID=UPI0025F496E1|nr:nuclear transport factor 2 family protein [Oryzomicrobium sp.]MCE1244479.1 nuclear transport factor 2 family protein [Oryzomicrobium sp.]